MRDEVYWLWLSLLNISPKARSAVIGQFGTAEQVYHAKEGSFRTLKGISVKEAEQLELKSLSDAERSLERCEELHIRITTISDPGYPLRLKQIYCPPAVLFVQGSQLDIDELPVISVIGTRRASPYGIKMGQKLAFEISKCGGTVLSLLTTGVDEAAAVGALKSGCPVIAVLGTDHAHKCGELRTEVSSRGTVISEYPPGKKLARHFYRERNRVAAGLSVGVVVVEAPERSGTRFFVADAVEQGKDVFAIPGNADAENSIGTLSMIKEGAKLVTCGADVMEEYERMFPNLVRLDEYTEFSDDADREPEEHRRAEDSPAENTAETDRAVLTDLKEKLSRLTEEQLHILQYIGQKPIHIDEIAEKACCPVPKVLAQLTVLEIKGVIRRKPGKFFCLNTEIVEK